MMAALAATWLPGFGNPPAQPASALSEVSPDLFGWQRNVTLHDVAFAKAHTRKDGLVIGMLKEDTVVRGRPCAKGWLHLHPNGAAAMFQASREIDLGRFKAPVGTWVFQNPEGIVTVCSFPADSLVQGHLCRGTGGPKGVQTAFYSSGALKSCFLPQDAVIDGVPCQSGLIRSGVGWHENGKLKVCVLSADWVREGRTYRQGSRIHMDAEGRVARVD